MNILTIKTEADYHAALNENDMKGDPMTKLVVRLLAGLVQLSVVVYCALLAWLMGVWMVDDHWAAQARNVDWYRTAGQRLALGILAAAIVGVALLVVNRGLARWDLVVRGTTPPRIAFLGAAAVAVASLAGAIHFLVIKPFM